MNLPQEIRAALGAGDFEGAARRFESYAAQIGADIRAGACDAAALAGAHDLLLAARAARAHLGERLHGLERLAFVAHAYRRPE